MKIIQADLMHFKDLNNLIRESEDNHIVIHNCIGQRFIASGMKGKDIVINGTPGNALGCYLDGCTIRVNGNAQDATGDTMNYGRIYVHGSCGDAAGYAMRGGRLYIRDNSGYRTGIHMKAYQDRLPVIVIGGVTGSFVGEYQAGGIIIVLGITNPQKPLVGYFCGTGMHGGKMYLRCTMKELPKSLPKQVVAREATAEDLLEIDEYLDEYCSEFGADKAAILDSQFVVLTPDTKNPYKQLYTHK